MYFRLDNGIYMVAGGKGGPGISHYKDCNVYLVEGKDDAYLIDGGSGMDTPITHAHGDHGGGVHGMQQAMPWIKVYSSKGEKRLLEEGTEEELGLVAAKKKGNYPMDYVFDHCHIDETVCDEQKFECAGSQITCVLLPGHSIESVCYIVDKNGKRYLFSGDSIYLDGKLSLINCYGSTMEGYRNNINKLAGRKIDALIPSHFRLTMSGGQSHVDKAIEVLEYSPLPPMM